MSETIPETNVPDLPVSEVTKLLTDEECPNVSICIPCYKRRKFLPLIMNNLFYMDYPKGKIEINILQDGPEDLMVGGELEYFKKQLAPAIVNYKYEKSIRRSIGDKRNRLVKGSRYKIIAMMDSDDIYLPSYLRYSISGLKEFKVGITSSASMIFIYPHHDYKLTAIRCGHKHQGHEACSVFTKRHHGSMGGFTARGRGANAGEGAKLIAFNEKQMANLDICRLMVCVAHGGGDEGNTIDKDQFLDANLPGELAELPHIVALRKIFSGEPIEKLAGGFPKWF
jgi:glycosyltransferase involved in cell wall biosynthesis